MTQHLSRLQPGLPLPGRARSSLPSTSFIFTFRAESRAGLGRAVAEAGAAGQARPGRAAVANGGRSLPSCSRLPSGVGSQEAVPGLRAPGHGARGPRDRSPGRFGAHRPRERRAPRLPRSPPPGAAARPAPCLAPPELGRSGEPAEPGDPELCRGRDLQCPRGHEASRWLRCLSSLGAGASSPRPWGCRSLPGATAMPPPPPARVLSPQSPFGTRARGVGLPFCSHFGLEALALTWSPAPLARSGHSQQPSSVGWR